MSNLRAVEQAKYAHDHRATFTKGDRFSQVEQLGAHGVFSNRQIAGFLSMQPHAVGQITEKTARTGGKLRPEALQPIIDLIKIRDRGEVSFTAVKAALDAGCSQNMLSRLTGVPQKSLSREVARARNAGL